MSEQARMAKTQVFISQAEIRSEELAKSLKAFVRKLTHTAPWLSADIPKGDNWPSALAERLKDASAGLVCLTPENVTNPWIHYEVGALSRTRSDKIWTVLLDLIPSDVKPPLGWRQHTNIDDESQVFEMIQSINGESQSPSEPEDLRDTFDRNWPDLQNEVKRIRELEPTNRVARRESDDVLAEILTLVREIAGTSWRSEKALGLQKLFYEALFDEQTPTISEMRLLKDFRRHGAWARAARQDDPLKNLHELATMKKAAAAELLEHDDDKQQDEK